MDEEKKIFGEQLKKYREAIGLKQHQFASLMDATPAYVSSVERGQTGIGIENMIKFAAFFGQKHYQLANPDIAPPSPSRLPATSKTAIAALKKTEKQNKQDDVFKIRLDELIASDFLSRARTASEILTEMFPDGADASAAKVTTYLTTTKRNKLVNTVSGREWGGKENRYILKSALADPEYKIRKSGQRKQNIAADPAGNNLPTDDN